MTFFFAGENKGSGAEFRGRGRAEIKERELFFFIFHSFVCCFYRRALRARPSFKKGQGCQAVKEVFLNQLRRCR